MNHIALHILQPFPATCLNRDDVGAPKNLIFGGATRSRVSSQCWKRHIRLEARNLQPGFFAGERTRRASDDLAAALEKLGLGQDEAKSIALAVCRGFLSDKEPAKPKGKSKKAREVPDPVNETEEAADESDGQTSTLLYFSPGEIEAMASAVVTAKSEGKSPQEAASKAAKNFSRKDAVDIAIFGRMVANDPTLNIEGAGLFAHAFSTHACDNDLDFWTAVDDAKDKSRGDDLGAANMGHAEFNSACYYRFIALNLDVLFYQKNGNGDVSANLGELLKEDVEVRREIVRAFLRASLLAMPTAKQNSFNGHALPEFAMGIVSSGQPFQLANAFEAPVQSRGEGWLQPSIEKLEKHFTKLKTVFGLQPLLKDEVRLSEETPLDAFIERLVAHVH